MHIATALRATKILGLLWSVVETNKNAVLAIHSDSEPIIIIRVYRALPKIYCEYPYSGVWCTVYINPYSPYEGHKSILMLSCSPTAISCQGTVSISTVVERNHATACVIVYVARKVWWYVYTSCTSCQFLGSCSNNIFTQPKNLQCRIKWYYLGR